MSTGSKRPTQEPPARAQAKAPKESPQTNRLSAFFALIAITVLAAALRMWRLGWATLSPDEFATYRFSSQSFSRLFSRDYLVETNPPTHYALQRLWFIFGDSRAAMRSLPLVLSLATIPIVYFLARRLAGRRAALIAAFLFATAPVHIALARNARVYSLQILAATSAVTALCWLLPHTLFREPGAASSDLTSQTESNSRTRRALLWIAYSFSLAVMLVAHNTSVLILPLIGLWIVTLWLFTKSISWSFVWRWAIATAPGSLLFAIWAPIVLNQASKILDDRWWVPPPDLHWIYSQMTGVYTYPIWGKPFMYLLAPFGLWALRRRRWSLAIVLLFLAGQPLLTYLFSLYRPIFTVNVLAWATVFFFICAGVAIANIKRAPMLFAVLAVTMFIQLFEVRLSYPSQRQSHDLAPLAASLAQRADTNDALVVAPPSALMNLQYLARHSPLPDQLLFMTYDDHRNQLEPWFGGEWIPRSQLPDRVANADRIWLLTEITPTIDLPEEQGFGAIRAEMANQFRLISNETTANHRLELYER